MNRHSSALRRVQHPRVLLASFLLSTAALLVACKPPPPSPQSCPTPPVIDGHVTVEFEGGKGRIRTPYFGSLEWATGCKYVRSVNMQFQWHENKLAADKLIPGPNFFLVKVSVQPAGKPHPAFKPLEAWQFEPALRHRKYPIEFYPRTGWAAPDTPRSDPQRYPVWGVRGTLDPNTRRPFLTGCQIPPLDPSTPDSVVDGDFPESNADAKCVGAIPVIKGKVDMSARVEIPAKGVAHIDRIYGALSELITSMVLE